MLIRSKVNEAEQIVFYCKITRLNRMGELKNTYNNN